MSIDWAAFLSAWEASAGSEARRQLPATDEAIAAAEARLGVALPTDYAAFCRVSNGWADPENHPVYAIRPLERIGWYPQEASESIECWSSSIESQLTDAAYLNYASHAHESVPSHLKHALLIAGGDAEVEEIDAGDLVLNPQVVHNDGSWEAILITSWNPGPYRSRDFTSLMIEQAESLFDVRPFREEHRKGWSPRETRFFIGAIGSAERKSRPAEIVDADTLLGAAATGSQAKRVEAIKAMAVVDGSRISRFLREVLGSMEKLPLRRAAAEAMASRGDMEAVELLRRVLQEEGPTLRNAAFAALAATPGEDARAALRTQLTPGSGNFSDAAYFLHGVRDEEAIARLEDIAMDADAGGASDTAWDVLAGGETPARLMQRALSSPSPLIRVRAAYTNALTRKALHDPVEREKALAVLSAAREDLEPCPPRYRNVVEEMKDHYALTDANRT